MREPMCRASNCSRRVFFPLLFGLSFLLAASPIFAQAPLRPGQPYAEAVKCADKNVLVCEDFDYPQNFTCGPFSYAAGQYAWINPGFTSTPNAGVYCQDSALNAANQYSTPPGGKTTGYVKRVKAGSAGTDTGCIRGDCDRNTSDTGNYANGSAPTKDLYLRLQLYFSTDYTFPTDLDNKILFLYPDRYTGKTDGNVDAGFYLTHSAFCPTPNQNFADALNFRVGSNSQSYKHFPADHSGTPGHMEYCDGVSTSNPPDDTPVFGRLFRFKKGKWYTVEYRYKLSDPGVRNGIIEAWVNGVKVYSASDLETCGNYGASQGSCDAISEIFLSSWFNPFGTDVPTGYTLIDNLIISRAYIGPPVGTTTDARPNAPTELVVR